MSTENINEAKNKEQNEQENIDEVELSSEEVIEEEIDTENSQEEPQKEEQIEQLKKELAEAKDSLLRKAAELENVRKRVQRERIALYEDAKIAAIEDFLPITEDMKRALSVSEGIEIEKGFLEGVKMVSVKFDEVLTKYGVEAINEENVPFDVNLHDAMLRQPAPNKKVKSDTVLQVLEGGYKIGNKVIKHAKVIVSE